MIDADVTGLIKNMSCISQILFGFTKIIDVFDLVISSDLLSTLPLFLPAAQRNDLLHSDEDNVAMKAIFDHVAIVKNIADSYCLISDYEHLVVDNKLHIEYIPLLCGAMLPPPSKTWTWNIALRPELYNNKDVFSRVGA